MTAPETESVRISKTLKSELKELAQSVRPRSTIQYLLEDAVEQYLTRVAEESTPYRTKEPPTKKINP